MMMKKLLFCCLPLVASVAVAQNDPQAKFAATITPKALQEKLTILAGPEMEGRGTGTPGQQKAAAWIESQFRKMGLKPGNGDSYQQVYPLYYDAMANPVLRVNGKTFNFDKDYTFGVANIYNGVKTFNNVVYVGNGAEADYTGLDVKGKIVMILEGGAPQGGPGAPGGGRGFNPMMAKMTAARNAGAAGILTITGAGLPRANATPMKSTRLALKVNDPAIFSATISDEVASALIGRTTKVPFAEWKDVNKGNYVAELQLGAEKKPEEVQASNVLGMIPGTDKADEYVFITGHYDHLGKRGDVIYYGADDDGSGSVGVMQMAEAFAKAAKAGHKPRRTMVFMTVSGEEIGLLGSDYFSEHPTVNLDKVSVDLNIDMIGRGDSSRKGDTLNYIYVIGHDKLSSDLAPINEGANKKYVNIELDYKYDDPKDPNRIYYRSDHYNFAKKGVPVLFFYDGMLGADYHKPTDTVDKIQFEIMAKRAQLIFHTGWDIANRDEMLKRDIPLTMPGR